MVCQLNSLSMVTVHWDNNILHILHWKWMVFLSLRRDTKFSWRGSKIIKFMIGIYFNLLSLRHANLAAVPQGSKTHSLLPFWRLSMNQKPCHFESRVWVSKRENKKRFKYLFFKIGSNANLPTPADSVMKTAAINNRINLGHGTGNLHVRSHARSF